MIYKDLDYNKDIDEVVSLINENLDPLYTKDTILWKHLHNPFGKSIAMVAIDGGKIVGVVFYMRYNFLDQTGKSIRSIRPLDVCTDKNQRGKGIFKILLQKCLENAKDYEILFSTPNQKSYPEFIKLNWQPLKREYFFCVGILFYNRYTKLDLKEFYINDRVKQKFTISKDVLEFIKWRYNKDYHVKYLSSNTGTSFLIYRISKLKNVKCIVLCDFIGDENLYNSMLYSVSKKEKVSIIYFLNNAMSENINFLITKKLDKAIIIYKENNFNLNNPLSITLSDIEGRL